MDEVLAYEKNGLNSLSCLNGFAMGLLRLIHPASMRKLPM
jgi:hypothetical protein